MPASSYSAILLEPLHSQPQTSRPQPVEPGMGVGWLVVLIGILCVALLIAARRRTRSTGHPQGMRSMPGGGGIGNALFDLGSVLQPDRPDAAVIQKLEEEDEQDDVGRSR